MFKLHRHKSGKSGEKVEFRFSHFQVSQVPNGWDKIYVSIISVETGKTIAKSTKATVRSGSCQWTEALSESIWVSQDDASKELEECIFKLVVSMGSSRSGILGEATLNLTDYTNSRDSATVSLPLKKCNYGTILQLKVQCHTPKMKFRDGKSWKKSTSHLEHLNVDHDDMDNKSDESDNMFNRSVGSSSSNHMGGSSFPDEPGNRDTSLSASGSHRSSDSGESFVGRTIFSPVNSLNGGTYNFIGRQDSSGSQNSSNNYAGTGDELCRSNPSSFNSRLGGSGTHLPNQWQQEITGQTSSHGPSLRPSDSSKEFLEAAQETIEELRGESRLWERNARKLKIDLEVLRKEFSDQSKHQEDMEMQLKAAYVERDTLNLEMEQLKSSLEEVLVKQANSDSKLKSEDIIHKQKELEDELRFQKDSNANLAQQLKKTQESNIELVSILQELEETIEKQRLEITDLSEQSQEIEHKKQIGNQSLLDIDQEAGLELSIKEEETIKLEEIPSVFHDPERPANMGPFIGGDPNLIKEIEALKIKVQELERDCAELTEENLELIFKMKESEKGIKKSETIPGSTYDTFLGKFSSSNSGSGIFQLKPKIYQLDEELRNKEVPSEVFIEPLVIQVNELGNKCTDLELDLKYFKDKAHDLDVKLQQSQIEVEDKGHELTELQEKLKRYEEIDLGNMGTLPVRNLVKSEPWSCIELSTLLSEIFKQLHLALVQVKRPWNHSQVNTEDEAGPELIITSSIDSVAQKEQAEVIVKSLLELNNLLDTKISDCRTIFQDGNLATRQQYAGLIEDQNLKELQSRNDEFNKEQLANKSKIEELKAILSLKEEEIDMLSQSKSELEDLLSSVQNEKNQLQGDLEIALTESSITSKCLDDVRQDFIVLSSSMDSHVSANKVLERKSMELESGKCELESHISELEQENVQLSERISGLEAQLRYLTNEKESNRLELENSRSLAVELRDEIGRLGDEAEIQTVELKQKLQETQKRLSEAVEESEYLKRSHSKLQVNVESLIEECNSLQKLTNDLRRQKLELHERSMILEVELSDSRKKKSEFCEKVEILEVKLFSLQKDADQKEKSFVSELEAILQKHKEHEEKLNQAQILLNQMDLDRDAEIENLQREVAHLTAQISSTHDEREKIASDAVREVSGLRADKIRLENSLHEVQAKVKSYETELFHIQQESGDKIQGLIGLVNASKQSEEMMMDDIRRMQRSMENIKSSEEKVKKTANELELNLKTSEYEREQLMEEVSSLKAQLLKISNLQNEFLALKSSLDETNFKKSKLEESLQSISEECEELKAERSSFTEKISSMQKVVSVGEDARRSRVALEEKLLRLECDLNAREALYAHDAELKNELNRIKRTNSQYQRKIQCLEEERDEFMKKVQALERDLKLKKEEIQDEKQVLFEKVIEINDEHHGKERQPLTKVEMSNDVSKDQHDLSSELNGQGDNKPWGNPQYTKGDDFESKIHSLEVQLAEALEDNNMYKVQLKSFLSERQTANDEVKMEGRDDKSSPLEVELKDMRERYFQMSLKYAEVEAQREELVMKLKSVKKEKRWFS